jgi:superoxide dismutase, Cu-Zn family
MRVNVGVVGAMSLLLAACAGNQTAETDRSRVGEQQQTAETAKAEMKTPEGKTIGTLTVTADPGGGARIEGKLTGLPPGTRAFHIHETGSCEPPKFESAGGHFNPAGKKHGELNPDGKHAGDLGNIQVDQDGSVEIMRVAEAVTMGEGQNSLFKPGGTAVVVHAGADDLKTDPSGAAGGRIACGVVMR